jgi:acyl-CoA reductase-like NAD-dependent aldehyde dehydrogenase
VLKPSEETPASARLFSEISAEAGLPSGVLNVVHGLGPEAGAPLVESPDVALVSFTGSGATGRWIQKHAGGRLAKVCLELGGKNALVVCDDADLSSAVHWAAQSAFSNAGQRCAAGSRIVVFDAVYEEFRDRFVEAAQAFEDVGPVISERALERILGAVEQARRDGARVLCGGERVPGPGWHLPPTVLEDVDPDAEVSMTEIFGPVTSLYRARGFEAALTLVNRSPYGLTAAVHTASLHRAARFAEKVEAGVVVVNGATHGSEAHMRFGGDKDSGTGWRAAGVEALDVYSDWKYVHVVSDPAKV